jgi:hypothetical protein
MRKLTLKYGGDCRKCGATLEAGAEALKRRYKSYVQAMAKSET